MHRLTFLPFVAAAGCVDSAGLGPGSAAHEVEEAAAALLSGPDNHVRLPAG